MLVREILHPFNLDWLLFGNGHGMASPLYDDVFYWLSGRFYRWSFGFGAQLHSIEWRMPRPGTKRRLIGEDFEVFRATRRGPRVEVSWAVTPSPKSAEDIRVLHDKLLHWDGYDPGGRRQTWRAEELNNA